MAGDSIRNPITALTGWLRDRFVRPGGAGNGTVAMPASRFPLTRETIDSIRRTLDDHDDGKFERSGRLAQLISRDADCFGALQQRLAIGARIPLCLESDDEALKLSLEADLVRMISLGAQTDLRSDAIQLGFGVAQIYYREAEDGALMPVVDPWPASAVEYLATQRQWYVHTTCGRQEITPGDGQWIVHTPWSAREPWMWGAIRPTAQWYVRSDDAASDAARHAEVHGIPVWKAKLPAGGRQTPDGKAFARSLRTMGRNAVIPLPQSDTAGRSYDVELISAEVDAYRIFEFLRGAGGRAFRLAILGQDMTSAHDGVGTYASSQTGRQITDDLGGADVAALAATLNEQFLPHVVRFRRGAGARATLRSAPVENTKAIAETWTAAAGALKTLQEGGVDVDIDVFTKRFGIPRRMTPGAPKRGQLFAYHLQYGLVTVNEARELGLGLPPRDGGDETPRVAAPDAATEPAPAKDPQP